MNFGALTIRMTLLFAVYRWCNDNSFTPCLLLRTQVGDVVINISQAAVRNLTVTSVALEFQASFNGALGTTTVRLSDVVAVYSGETGEGTLLVDSPLLSNTAHAGLHGWSFLVSHELQETNDCSTNN